MSDEQKWHPFFLLQPVWNAILALAFEFGVGGHDVQAERFLDGKMSLKELGERSRPFHKTLRKQLLKDSVLFPLLTFWNSPRVLLGNLIANLIRTLLSYAILSSGHFPGATPLFTEPP